MYLYGTQSITENNGACCVRIVLGLFFHMYQTCGNTQLTRLFLIFPGLEDPFVEIYAYSLFSFGWVFVSPTQYTGHLATFQLYWWRKTSGAPLNIITSPTN
jgi:hypothetical protein